MYITPMNANTEYKVVGSGCLAEFLGYPTPEETVSLFTFLAEAVAAAEDNEGGSSGGATHFRLQSFLGWVAASIRVDGWLSRTNARNMGRDGASTADMAIAAMVDFGRGNTVSKEYIPTEEDYSRASKATEYLRAHMETHAEDNDYMHNLSIVLRVGSIDFRTSGLAASIIPTAEREMGREVERRQFSNLKETSRYMGEVKGKLTGVKATVTGASERDSDWGVTTHVKFVTEDGCALTWWASGSVASEWVSGNSYLLCGTVKKHDEYQGLKQTILTRVVAVTQEVLDAEVAKAAKKAIRAAKKAEKKAAV